MSRKIQINLPDGIAKRTIIAGVDAGMKWGHGLYLEIFTRGLIEFEKEPTDFNLFVQTLDDSLKAVNSDYEAERSYNL